DIVVEKTSGSLRLRFLAGRGAERRSERLSSESEPSSEFVALAEEDREYSSASESDASEASFKSTPPAPEEDSLSDDDDDDDDDDVLGLAGLFLTGVFFLLTF